MDVSLIPRVAARYRQVFQLKPADDLPQSLPAQLSHSRCDVDGHRVEFASRVHDGAECRRIEQLKLRVWNIQALIS